MLELLDSFEDSAAGRRRLAEGLDIVNSEEAVGIALIVKLEFVRLLGNSALVDPVVAPEQAWRVASGWAQFPNVTKIAPGPDHARILHRLLIDSGVASRHVNDAHLAALCLERKATLAGWPSARL